LSPSERPVQRARFTVPVCDVGVDRVVPASGNPAKCTDHKMLRPWRAEDRRRLNSVPERGYSLGRFPHFPTVPPQNGGYGRESYPCGLRGGPYRGYDQRPYTPKLVYGWAPYPLVYPLIFAFRSSRKLCPLGGTFWRLAVEIPQCSKHIVRQQSRRRSLQNLPGASKQRLEHEPAAPLNVQACFEQGGDTLVSRK